MNKKIGHCLSTAPSKPSLVFYVKSRIHHLKVFVNLSTNYFRANIPAKGRFCLHWQKSLDHLTCKFISCGDQIVGRKECFLFLYSAIEKIPQLLHSMFSNLSAYDQAICIQQSCKFQNSPAWKLLLSLRCGYKTEVTNCHCELLWRNTWSRRNIAQYAIIMWDTVS